MPITFTNDEDLTLIEPGKYEVIIDSLEKKASKADPKKTNLSICYRIRDDIEQGFKNRLIWETLGEAVNNSSDGWWPDTKRLSRLVRAALDPTSTVNGKPQWSFADAETCIQKIAKKKISIFIDQEYNDFTGNDRNVIKYLSYEEAIDKHEVKPQYASDSELSNETFPF